MLGSMEKSDRAFLTQCRNTLKSSSHFRTLVYSTSAIIMYPRFLRTKRGFLIIGIAVLIFCYLRGASASCGQGKPFVKTVTVDVLVMRPVRRPFFHQQDIRREFIDNWYFYHILLDVIRMNDDRFPLVFHQKWLIMTIISVLKGHLTKYERVRIHHPDFN